MSVKRQTCFLFLDVGGVLSADPNVIRASRALDRFQALVEKIQLVMKICIVVTSEVRRKGSLEELKKGLFKETKFAKLIVGTTPIDNRRRGEQIESWIEERRAAEPVEIVLILDDNEFDIKGKFPEQFVKVDSKALLTEETAQRALVAVMDQLLAL